MNMFANISEDPRVTSFHDLSVANLKRMSDFQRAYPEGQDSFKDWSPLEWAGAVCGEAGELANKCKKLKRGQDIPSREIADELADVVIYCDLLAQKLNIDLGEAVRHKFNERSETINSEVRL